MEPHGAATTAEPDLDRQPFHTGADPRYIAFRGEFIDDVKLPDMLHLAFVRSPHAHAAIKEIDTSAADACPGVRAVITGLDLEGLGLSSMPTLVGDRQDVLPTDLVQFYGQEVAAVLGVDRYAAADGAAAVRVEYEPLPPVIDPIAALRPGAPLVRWDKPTNHVWRWQVGDAKATDHVFAEAAVKLAQEVTIPRISGAHLETCGCVASWDATEKTLTLWATTHSPEAVRTTRRISAGMLRARCWSILPTCWPWPARF
ncbi:MAG: carbon-monoxide dehydrogenase, large subunit [Chloroflexi bacterium]|nr:carbon-monoxide dehydrogenase, large subunit [Chloroflexota bacterium]